MKNNPLDTSKRLRNVLDGNDVFLQHHQTIKIRRPKKKIPSWVESNVEIQKLLLLCFPLMKTDPNHRARAGRWARVINLYYKRQWSRGQIAAELHQTLFQIDSIIRAVKRSAAGLRTDSGGVRGGRKGRPRRHACVRT